MNLVTQAYLEQAARWPSDGRHIMAQFDSDSIVVYQAYSPRIGEFAAGHGFFGGDFRLGRMSWIKPNFLWMMYRSGWGQKEGQEVTLAVRLKRAAFDTILAQAVHSSFVEQVYADCGEWSRAVARSNVRLQWDPDHDPLGRPLARRAIQLGLRGEVLANYARDWLLGIDDISPFVAEQRLAAKSSGFLRLVVPCERPYPVSDPFVAARLGVSKDISETGDSETGLGATLLTDPAPEASDESRLSDPTP